MAAAIRYRKSGWKIKLKELKAWSINWFELFPYAGKLLRSRGQRD